MISLHQHNVSNVLSYAHSTNEQFEDVTVITAQSFFVNLAYQAAADVVFNEGLFLSLETVHAVALAMIAEHKLVVQEHVRVSEAGITVCIDVIDVHAEDVMWRALDRVASALDSLNGDHGVVVYGSDLMFDVEQTTPLMMQLG